jgi:hypothetical protein
MLPHERALVQRLANEPFALLGVSSDGEADDVRPRLAEADITWRNAIDVTPSGPWATQWNVSGWPTLYLIDANGVIREKWIGSPGDDVLDAKIDELIAESKAG